VTKKSDQLSLVQAAGMQSQQYREADERAEKTDLRRGRRSGRNVQISTLVSPEARHRAERLRQLLGQSASLADVLENSLELYELVGLELRTLAAAERADPAELAAEALELLKGKRRRTK